MYGVDVTQYKTEEELNERLSELKEEKTSIIENMIVSNILENYDIPLDKCNAVEIGPGAGIMLDWLAPQINHLHCVDISETILNGCKEQNKQHKFNIGKLKNIGFDIASQDYDYDSYIFTK